MRRSAAGATRRRGRVSGSAQRGLVACLIVSGLHAAGGMRPVWGAPVIEPDFHLPLTTISTSSEHESDPALATDGARGLMLWKEGESGTISTGRAHYSATFDGGMTWAPAVALVRTPTMSRLAAPALAAAGSGRFHYLSVQPITFQFQQLRIETADLSSGAVVWVRNLVLPVGHTSIVYPDIACDRATGVVHVTYTHFDDITSGLASPSRIYYRRSADGGDTWGAPLQMSAEGCDRSRVAVGPNGEVYLAWVDAIGERVRLRRSDDGGLSFGAEQAVGEFLDNRNAGMYAWLRPSTAPHPVYSQDMGVPDVPRLIVDTGPGSNRGRVYMAWTDHAAGTRGPHTGNSVEGFPNSTFETATIAPIGHDLYGFTLSSDEGGTADVWGFDGVAGQTVWVSGRVSLDPSPGYVETKLQVMYCRTPGGDVAEIARTNTVQTQVPGDPPVYAMRPMLFTLPSTGRYYFIVGGHGPFSSNYTISLRDWQVSPASASRDQRDVVLLSSGDRGQTWGSKVRVGDAPHYYDESHPEIALDATGRVHVTWLDRRAEALCGTVTDQYWAYSLDAGQTFSAGYRLSSQSTIRREPGAPLLAQFHGERNALAASGEWVHAFWSDRRNPVFVPPVKGSDLWGTRMQVGGLVSTAVARFGAEASAMGARVTWRLHDARGLLDVEVERADAESELFARIAAQSGDPTREGEHAVVDGSGEPGATYRYRLALRYADGRLLHEAPVAVTLPQRTLALAWEPPTPNPTVGRTRLALSLPREGHVEVEVYDIAGQRVARLHRGDLPAGRHDWQWPAASESAAPGIYLVRASALGESRSTRVIVTR